MTSTLGAVRRSRLSLLTRSIAISDAQPGGSSGSSAGNAKCTIADGEDTANPVANLRSAIERVTISKTTISIELTDAVAAESRDRTLILHWTPPSPTLRREIDEWAKTFGCHWKTSDWTYKTTDNTNFFIGKKAAAFSGLKTGEAARVTRAHRIARDLTELRQSDFVLRESKLHRFAAVNPRACEKPRISSADLDTEISRR